MRSQTAAACNCHRKSRAILKNLITAPGTRHLRARGSDAAAFYLSSTGDLYYVLSEDVPEIHQGGLSGTKSCVLFPLELKC